MTIRAIIFDFGSVLVQMGDEGPRLELADQLGLPLPELNRLIFDSDSATRAMVGALTSDQHWQAVAAALGVPATEMPAIMAQFWSSDVINDELVAVIPMLSKDYKIGLLSNAWDDLRKVLATRIPIGHLFDDIVVSAEVQMGKPAPGIFHLAVQRLGVQPEEAVFIDDVLVNVEAARANGLKAIHYQNNAKLFSDLRMYNIHVDG